jgi:hypothetical protein
MYNKFDLETLKVILEREIELYNERNVHDQIEIYEVRNAMNTINSKEELKAFIEELKSK